MTGGVFAAALLDPEHAVPANLRGPDGAPAGRRFSVYRNNVAVGLKEALAQAFPVLRKLLGEAFFDAMAGVFLRAHPPSSPLMMAYGVEMPAFLAGFPPVAHLGYLPDVARLEIALRESYHAADATPIVPGDLAGIAPAELAALRVTLAPALRLLRSAWPVHGIWSANTHGTPVPDLRVPEDVLVTRPAWEPLPLPLPKGGHAFVVALAAQASLGDAVQAAGDDFDLAATIAMLMDGGAITGLKAPNPRD
jgi:hypothetical protein